MNIYFKVISGVLLAVSLCLVVEKRDKDLALVLSIAVCCMVAAASATFLSPVLSFWKKLEDVGQLDHTMVDILLKAVGIGLLGELVSLLCQDFGRNAVGKTVQLLSSAVILWLSLPLFQSLMDMLERILGGL